MSCYGESKPNQTIRTTETPKLPKCHSILIISAWTLFLDLSSRKSLFIFLLFQAIG